MLVKRRPGVGDWKKVPCEEIYGKDVIFTKVADGWVGNSIDYSEDFFELIGYFIAEGYVLKRKTSKYNYRVVFTTKLDIEYARALLIKNKLKFYETVKNGDTIDFNISDKGWHTFFSQFGLNSYEKTIPRWMLDAPIGHLQALLKGYYQGDGYKGVVKRAVTVSKQLADNLQELAMKIGWSADIGVGKQKHTIRPIYRVKFNDKNVGRDNVHVYSEKWYKIAYDDYTYCVDCGGVPVYVRRGGKPFWSYQTYSQLTQSTLTKFFEIFPDLQKFHIKRDNMLLLPNGNKIFFKSMDEPELIRGLNLHWFWLDEGDGMSLSAWEIVRSRVATTKGRGLVTSTIYPNSWVYEKVFKVQDPDYEIVSWESRENPSFPQAEWDKLQREMDPMRFEREYGGRFVFEAGRIYADALDYGLVDRYPADSRPLVTVFGLDFGVSDPTAIIVMTYNSDGCWYVIDEFYKPGMPIQEINHWLEFFIERHGRPYLTVFDYAGGVATISLTPKCNPHDYARAGFDLPTKVICFQTSHQHGAGNPILFV